MGELLIDDRLLSGDDKASFCLYLNADNYRGCDGKLCLFDSLIGVYAAKRVNSIG
jgi:hypothetical protein